MIELKSVSKIFRTDIVETYALREFDLSIAAGEFVAITGHSGSGKTSMPSPTISAHAYNELAQRAQRKVHMVDVQIAADSPIG